jgi:hypothetical protein
MGARPVMRRTLSAIARLPAQCRLCHHCRLTVCFGRPQVYARLHYAFARTQRTLRAVLAIKDDYEIIPAFALIVAGFGAFQGAIDGGSGNIFVSCATGFILGALFFLFMIGLITVIGALFVFTYNFIVGEEIGFISPKISRWHRVSTIVLSAMLSGIAIAAVLQLFYEGTKGVVPVTQNTSLSLNDWSALRLGNTPGCGN